MDKEWITERWDEGYYITSVAGAGRGLSPSSQSYLPPLPPAAGGLLRLHERRGCLPADLSADWIVRVCGQARQHPAHAECTLLHHTWHGGIRTGSLTSKRAMCTCRQRQRVEHDGHEQRHALEPAELQGRRAGLAWAQHPLRVIAMREPAVAPIGPPGSMQALEAVPCVPTLGRLLQTGQALPT